MQFDHLEEQLKHARTLPQPNEGQEPDYRSTLVKRLNPAAEPRASSASLAMSTAEKLRKRVMSGQPLEYRCYLSIPGYLQASLSTRRLSIDLSGRIQIVEIDARNNDAVLKHVNTFNLRELIQIIYGRLSLKDSYRVTFMVDGLLRKQANNSTQDYSEEVYFENKSYCFELIEAIKMILHEHSNNRE